MRYYLYIVAFIAGLFFVSCSLSDFGPKRCQSNLQCDQSISQETRLQAEICIFRLKQETLEGTCEPRPSCSSVVSCLDGLKNNTNFSIHTKFQCLSGVCILETCREKVNSCDQGYRCVEQVCKKSCDANSSCPQGKVCDRTNKYCVDCLSSKECKGQLCVGGKCVPCNDRTDCKNSICDSTTKKCRKCEKDEECGSGLKCNDGQCNQKTEKVPCSNEKECPKGLRCFEGYCASCNQDKDCENHSSCVEGSCIRKSCATSKNCSHRLACVGGFCDKCTSHSECGENAECKEGYCFVKEDDCKTSADCQGKLCIANKCQGCTSNKDCVAAGMNIGNCLNNGRCSYCTTSSQCSNNQAGKLCVQRFCRQCKGNSDCAHTRGNFCNRYFECVATCNNDDDCSKFEAKNRCSAGSCKECSEHSHCNAKGKPICEQSTGTCVSCENTGLCSNKKPNSICVSNECVECRTSADCKTSSLPLCRQQKCVGCKTNQDCDEILMGLICDSNKACSKCSSNSQCGTNFPFCSSKTKLCVQCIKHSDCKLENVCRNDGTCGACKNDGDCLNAQGGPKCHPLFRKCVRCMSDTDCNQTKHEFCLKNNTCGICSKDSDCVDYAKGKKCHAGICKPCKTSTDCNSSFPICDQTSFQCVSCKDSNQCHSRDSGSICKFDFCDGCSSNLECISDKTLSGAHPAGNICDLGKKRCSPCNSHDDCAGHSSGEICLPSKQCGKCTNNSDCKGHPHGEFCEAPGSIGACGCNPGLANKHTHCAHNKTNLRLFCSSSRICVECLSSQDCKNHPTGSICDPQTNTCRGCTSIQECKNAGPPFGSFCQTTTGKCDCYAPQDCSHHPAGNKTCTNRFCGP